MTTPARQAKYLYLTTTGRRTGRAREIEIWFTEDAGRYYLVAEQGEAAGWVKNLRAQPRVSIRVGGRMRAATAHVLHPVRAAARVRAARARSEAKYGWGDGLVVELVVEAGSPRAPAAAGRRRGRARVILAAVAVALAAAPGWAQSPHQHHGGGAARSPGAHDHPAPPPAYATVSVPTKIWTDARTLQRGKTLWRERCAICHGERGDGRGPAAPGLAVKPEDLTNATMVQEMSPRYWFWRVSEGGQVEPFKTEGSTMPAWKLALSVADRWAVIAYAHTFSRVTPKLPTGPTGARP